jgi:dihydroorotase-like cyclic amidohydrolase
MLDLLITNAYLPDGRTDMSVAVQGAQIVAVEQGLAAPAHETLDAGGMLLAPPFVDAHFTWTRPSATACRASMRRARCWKALRCGASSNHC